MSPRNYFFLVFLIMVLLLLIFFLPSYGWILRGWLSPKNSVDSDTQALAAQNQSLQAQLATLEIVASELPQTPSSTIRALVYSRYPLDFRNEITLNVGTDEGVQVGKAVLFQGLLVGTVEQVFPENATVLTIFDTRFRLPVRIGNAGVDALVQGGPDPEAVSIAKDASVNVGDIVYTAASGMPYGIPIGVIAGVSLAPDNLFQQASLSFAYDINAVQTVEVEK